ncbi:MAG: TetR/AcrR family transcriptional regulator [Lachnospiraceae bacterium]|nr:TetR/AcrR family transcriptional regulator [Lachnospiraceae bacterium]
MAVEKTDLRVGRTQKLLQDAFLELMQEVPFEDITVTEIAERAMINRKTFYAHYGTKQELYDAMVSHVIDELCETVMYLKETPPTKELDAEILEADAKAFVEVMERYKEEFLILLNPQINYVWFPILENAIITKRKGLMLRTDNKTEEGDVPFKLYLDMITSQMVIWIYWWLSQEDYTVDEGAQFLCRLMNRSMANVFRYVKPPKVIHSKKS